MPQLDKAQSASTAAQIAEQTIMAKDVTGIPISSLPQYEAKLAGVKQ